MLGHAAIFFYSTRISQKNLPAQICALTANCGTRRRTTAAFIGPLPKRVIGIIHDSTNLPSEQTPLLFSASHRSSSHRTLLTAYPSLLSQLSVNLTTASPTPLLALAKDSTSHTTQHHSSQPTASWCPSFSHQTVSPCPTSIFRRCGSNTPRPFARIPSSLTNVSVGFLHAYVSVPEKTAELVLYVCYICI